LPEWIVRSPVTGAACIARRTISIAVELAGRAWRNCGERRGFLRRIGC
jgi:hypothetical protein